MQKEKKNIFHIFSHYRIDRRSKWSKAIAIFLCWCSHCASNQAQPKRKKNIRNFISYTLNTLLFLRSYFAGFFSPLLLSYHLWNAINWSSFVIPFDLDFNAKQDIEKCVLFFFETLRIPFSEQWQMLQTVQE